MLVLVETVAGFGLFKVLQENKLKQVQDLASDFETLESASKVVQLKKFLKFTNTQEAVEAATSIVQSKLSKDLKKFLKKNVEEPLGIIDVKLASLVKEKAGLEVIHGDHIIELQRGIKSQLEGLISGMGGHDLTPMSLGLSHSLARYKLKFSPDKVDVMIIQAIGLLDDLDKELNTYAMRVREWYGWHFPEMAKILADNVLYAKSVQLMGTREKAVDCDFSAISMDEDVEEQLKSLSKVSMGTEISDGDLDCIKDLCEQVIELSEYRGQLADYLRSRMRAVAPNLTCMVGELVGARLISHAGSLINLAKLPGSTIQILGAEKALFRALKTKHDTPKYGLIFHASLVGQASAKNKGKISRMLASKCALSIRVDALGEDMDAGVGLDNRVKVEKRLGELEKKKIVSEVENLRDTLKSKAQPEAYEPGRQGTIVAQPKGYSAGADVVIKKEEDEDEVAAKVKSEDGEVAPPKKKKKKSKGLEAEGDEEQPKKKTKTSADDGQAAGDATEKKKKKRSKQAGDEEEEQEPLKKKKKSKVADDGEQPVQKKTKSKQDPEEGTEEPKKKKKKSKTEVQEPQDDNGEEKPKKKSKGKKQ